MGVDGIEWLLVGDPARFKEGDGSALVTIVNGISSSPSSSP